VDTGKENIGAIAEQETSGNGLASKDMGKDCSTFNHFMKHGSSLTKSKDGKDVYMTKEWLNLALKNGFLRK
jgi:hypothetical protein